MEDIDQLKLRDRRGIIVLKKSRNGISDTKQLPSYEKYSEVIKKNFENHVKYHKRENDSYRKKASTHECSIQQPWRQKSTLPRYKSTIMETIQSRLFTFSSLYTSVELIDESHCWNNDLAKILDNDQRVSNVIGVLGESSSGKSTILSLLAGNNMRDRRREMIFNPRGIRKHNMHYDSNATVQSFICLERTILLDSDGISLFDVDGEFSDKQLKDLKIISFMVTVCTDLLVIVHLESDILIWESIISKAIRIRDHFSNELVSPYLECKSNISSDSKSLTLKPSLLKRPRLTYCLNRNDQFEHVITDILNNKEFIKLPNCNKSDGDSLALFDRSIEFLRQRFIRKDLTWPTHFSEQKWFEFAENAWNVIDPSIRTNIKE